MPPKRSKKSPRDATLFSADTPDVAPVDTQPIIHSANDQQVISKTTIGEKARKFYVNKTAREQLAALGFKAMSERMPRGWQIVTFFC